MVLGHLEIWRAQFTECNANWFRSLILFPDFINRLLAFVMVYRVGGKISEKMAPISSYFAASLPSFFFFFPDQWILFPNPQAGNCNCTSSMRDLGSYFQQAAFRDIFFYSSGSLQRTIFSLVAMSQLWVQELFSFFMQKLLIWNTYLVAAIRNRK